MTAPIIVVENRKGGVGKSTIATHVAAGLATLGYRVGLVDTDSQGHAGLLLGLPESDGLFNIMIQKRDLQEVVVEVPSGAYSTQDRPAKGALYLLPSSDRTYQIPHMLKQDESFLFLEVMEQMAELYALDVIIIDTNPTLSMFDGAIFLAADGHLYVTECEMLAFDGVRTAIEQMQRFSAQRQRYLHRESRVVGIIPNKMRPRTRLHRHNIGKLAEAYGDLVWSPVRLATIWSECTNACELVFTYAPSGGEASDAWDIVKRTEEVLRSWQAVTTN